MNLFCTILIVFTLAVCSARITQSIDCLGGNKTACEAVAKRYEATP